MHRRGVALSLAMALLTCGLTGCGGSAGSSQVIMTPGHYAPPAQPTPRLRVGLPDVEVTNGTGTAVDVDLMAVASDELLGLLQSSDRFDLIERQRLRDMLAEQKLTDMIQPGRLVHPGAIRGVDFVFLAQLNDLSVKKQAGPETMSVTGLMQATHIEKVISRLVINANVSLAVVDVKTGQVDIGRSDKFHLVATPEELGLKLTGDQLKDLADVHLGPEDTHRVLRFVLDTPLKPMLPRIDRFALSLPAQTPHDSQAARTDVVQTAAPATQSTGQRKQLLLICPDCGAKLTGDEEFCPTCHRKLK